LHQILSSTTLPEIIRHINSQCICNNKHMKKKLLSLIEFFKTSIQDKRE